MSASARRLLMAAATAGSGTPFGGHDGVADWVTANSSKVLAYYPMSDAAASGTMSDSSGNARHGTYGAGIGSRSISGETVADFTGGTTSIATVADAAWLDSIAGLFMVANLDTFTTYEALVSRDSHSSGDRNWQFRMGSASQLHLISIGGGNPSSNYTAPASAALDHSGGWVYDGSTNYGMIDGTVGAGSPNPTTDLFETGSSILRIGHVTSSNTPAQLFDGALGSLVILNNTADSTDLSDLHLAFYGTTV